MLSPELEAGLYHTFALAQTARHRFVTVDHLLMHLSDEPRIAGVLADNGVDISKLRDETRRAVSRIQPDASEQPFPTTDFQRAIAQAIESVQAEGRRRVESIDVLKFA